MDRKGLAVFAAGIGALNEQAIKQAQQRLDSLSKPAGSLGRLEELATQLAGITGKAQNHITKKRLLVLAADNGVVEEGVSPAPPSITLAQSVCIARGKSGASVLARLCGAEVVVVDVGIASAKTPAGIVDCKIAPGTKNIAKTPAMTEHQCLQAIETGITLAKSLRGNSEVNFKVAGFISDERHMVGKELIGVKVYAVNPDLFRVLTEREVRTKIGRASCRETV